MMLNESKIRAIVLFLGDTALLYFALAAVILIRYGADGFQAETANHLGPFTVIFILWVAIFYISGLYTPQKSGLNNEADKTFISSILISSALSAISFYFIPYFGIAPKTNLFIFIIIFGLADYLWRQLLNRALISGGFQARILLIGGGETADELARYLETNPQAGYQIAFRMKEGLRDKEFGHLFQIVLADKIDLVVIPAHLKKDAAASRTIYQLMALGIPVANLASIYENVFQKIPVKELEEGWFLENIGGDQRFFDTAKRGSDIVFALIAGLIILPVMILIIPLLILASGFPVIYRQKRIGKNEKEFTIYKLRTMKIDAEAGGAVWASLNDNRVTPIGRILRRVHLDEAPQLYNILKGDLSFVGPRPERPEFVKQLKEKIPFYEMRHIIKPGFTGWAQINYRYGASVEDAYEKLQYDLYYVKNRSLLLDIATAIKTAKLLFINPE